MVPDDQGVALRHGNGRFFESERRGRRQRTGGQRIEPGSVTNGVEQNFYFNAYVAENRGYRGYDKSLRNAYNFGFAIHDDHTVGRYHHVSLGYTLGLDAKADITAAKQ